MDRSTARAAIQLGRSGGPEGCGTGSAASGGARQLAAGRAQDALLRALRRVVEARLAHDEVTLTRCAADLGLAPRTLQRRLAQGGTSFGAMVDGIRRRRALDALEREGDSITALAMSLGYADTAHFIRAFRRWAGTTPAAYRAARTTSGARGPDLPEPGGAPHLRGTHGGAP